MSDPSDGPDRGSGDPNEASGNRRPPASALFVASYPRTKRLLDLVVGSLALVMALPILAFTRAAMVASGDRGPFLYRATRIGEGGRPITVLKVRTMRPGVGGSLLTSHRDARVTKLGKLLRSTKLDELPQLWNVMRGEMALVGPRPEDPSYVDMDDPLHRRVFVARPGITGLAQLAYRHEADLLVGPNADRHYRETILPAKLRLDSEYLDRRSVRLDLEILGRTLLSVVSARRRPNVS